MDEWGVEFGPELEVDKIAVRLTGELYKKYSAHILSPEHYTEFESSNSSGLFGLAACSLPSGIVACFHHSASSDCCCYIEERYPVEDMYLDHTQARYWACHTLETWLASLLIET